MKTLLLTGFLAIGLLIGVTPEEQAKKFCDCLKAANTKKTPEEVKKERGKCLVLDEKLRAELGDNADTKKTYVKKCEECMISIRDAEYGINFDATKSYDDKVKDVCGCFEKNKAAGMSAKMYCSQLQSRYAKTFGEDTASVKKFNIHINTSCQ